MFQPLTYLLTGTYTVLRFAQEAIPLLLREVQFANVAYIRICDVKKVKSSKLQNRTGYKKWNKQNKDKEVVRRLKSKSRVVRAGLVDVEVLLGTQKYDVCTATIH